MTYAWLDAPATAVADTARQLVGWLAVANGVTIRLTETEAYAGLGGDPASHAHRGRTSRNAAMFGPAGHLYLYRIYGMHTCANVTCGPAGQPAGVLLRAGEVVSGVDVARSRRPSAKRDIDLASGPARLVEALDLPLTAYGTSVVDGTGPLTLRPPAEPVPDKRVVAGPRVGVTAAHDLAWRFWIADDPTVSAYRRHVPRTSRKDPRGMS
ncbi:DNA-3-methyladenine glycosylase [Paractinoplanes brasiliensis]|uniref:Putative 3-methyladenine DNA glycosylase n=1 Tax=Paractinoplanes brasiliensis TaxID=52695 RepID=A0A4R6JZ83_9ACTN|nr:DNA-3-methyladenine glycosylase [Actinoplanes brasiliensis]TDO41727.1 DNA-3-methyladenine glycosylase [Actinoplanes brasiliensis]GID33358.1 putative 3-methyladenine DNA glycosylase [Actinoplanes brasiliensis]